MQKRKIISLALAGALCVGLAAPAQALEKSLWPDYFSIQSEYVRVDQDIDFYYGLNDVAYTYEGGGYYAIADDATFTITNLQDSGYVSFYYEPYVLQTESLLLWNESPESDDAVDPHQDDYIGKYVCYNGGLSQQYFYNTDGEWELIEGIYDIYSEATANLEDFLNTFPAQVLSAGESVTFTLPQPPQDEDIIYLLWVFYTNPETQDHKWQYSEFKYDNEAAAAVDEPSTDEPSTDEPVAGFTDVHTSDYYAEAVAWAKENGVASGTTDTTFSPAATVTRAQAVSFLWRAAGSPAPASTVSPFTDVADPNAYYYNAVLWAAEQGITSGVGDSLFDTNGTLTYDQILAMLCRAAGGESSGSDWSAAAVNWAADNGLTDGLTFTAKDNCPRADVVYCLWMQLAPQ